MFLFHIKSLQYTMSPLSAPCVSMSAYKEQFHHHAACQKEYFFIFLTLIFFLCKKEHHFMNDSPFLFHNAFKAIERSMCMEEGEIKRVKEFILWLLPHLSVDNIMKEIVCDAKHDHRRKGIERECHESARKGNIFGVKKQKQIFWLHPPISSP